MAGPRQPCADGAVKLTLEALDGRKEKTHGPVSRTYRDPRMPMIRTLAPKMAPRLVLQRDTWERHRLVARLVRGRGTVLDVGGRPGELDAVLPGCEVTVFNVD